MKLKTWNRKFIQEIFIVKISNTHWLRCCINLLFQQFMQHIILKEKNMDITASYFLLLVFPIILIILSLLPNLKYMNLFLLAVSLLSYAYGGKSKIFFLLVQVFVTYFIAQQIQKSNNSKTKKVYLYTYYFLLIVSLLLFKYSQPILKFSDIQSKRFIDFVVLPLGYSYYTFKSVSVIFDTYRGKVDTISFQSIALYVSYFPEIFAGPITLFKDFVPQISQRVLGLTNIITGLKKIIVGLFKKVVIADSLALVISKLFGVNMQYIGSQYIWLGILYYSMQLYYDFSGYSNISQGISEILGFKIKDNFNKPYKSKSITEFWRKWHISLSQWFKEYLYFPIGGNRLGIRRTYINLFIVFLATGIWHGSSITFLIWGIWHGVFIVLERLITSKYPNFFSSKYLSRFYTLLIVVIGWAIFRANSVDNLLLTFNKLFKISLNSSYGFYEIFTKKSFIIFLMSIILTFTNLSYNVSEWMDRSISVKIIVLVIMTIIILFFLLKSGNVPPIYSVF